MTKRLGVASLGVAGLSYVTSPVTALVAFIFFVACPITYSAYLSRSDIDRKSFPPTM